MIKIFVYASNKEQAERAVQLLKSANAEHVELRESLKQSTQQPKENRYLFISETPAEMLAGLVQNELPENAYAEVLEQWYTTQSQILEAYQSQKKRAFLISLSSLDKDAELIRCINNAWGVNLSSSEPTLAESKQYAQSDTLLAYLVQNLIQQTPPLQELSDTIAQNTGVKSELYTESEAIAAYRQLNTKNAKYKIEISDARIKLSQVSQLRENTESILNQLDSRQNELDLLYIKHEAYRKDSEHKIKFLQESIEGLLLQLNESQEQIEHKTIDLQNIKSINKSLDNSLVRIMTNNPEMVDCESITHTPIDSELNATKWVIESLQCKDFKKELIEFDTFIENNTMGIRFAKFNSHNIMNLQRWPNEVGDAEYVEIIPAGKKTEGIKRATLLQSLSSTDWKTINHLTKIIKDNCDKNPFTLKSIENLTIGLDSIPLQFRFDDVWLKKIQNNTDYEHIWFEFKRATFKYKEWNSIEIRIGAANINPKGFTQYPKIEIPLIDSTIKPFDSWFVESSDEFGDKLEIRLDLKKQNYDIDVWKKIENNDKDLIINMVSSISKVISLYSKKWPSIERGWDSWYALGSECAKLLIK